MFRRRNVAENQLRLPSSSSSRPFMEGKPPPKRDFREHLKWVTRKIKRWFHSFRFTRSRSRKRSASPTPFISAVPNMARSRTPPTPTTPVTPRTIYTPRMSADRRPILYSNEMSDSEIPEFYELSPSKRPRSQGLCPSLPVSYGPPVYHAQTTDVRDESLYEVKGAPESRWSLSTLDTRSIRNLLIGDFKVWNLLDEAKTVFPFHDPVAQRARVR
ncbi:unnamed protein product [Clonostachys rosea f. rosea IK726]|uniref:Uncharacterized protein n=2 Tax=Bionectria ochroleuca TaxID=29856 RepID=A0A8H7TUJ0_BIOOC|nr:unnamed protein product [Clonostachys rosea f. rosea IK726]